MVVIGGIASSTFLTLVMLPVLYGWIESPAGAARSLCGPFVKTLAGLLLLLFAAGRATAMRPPRETARLQLTKEASPRLDVHTIELGRDERVGATRSTFGFSPEWRQAGNLVANGGAIALDRD